MTNNFMKKSSRIGFLRVFEMVCKPSEGWPSNEARKWGIWNLALSFGENTGLLMLRCLYKSSVVKLGRRCKKLNLFFSSIGKRSSLYSVNIALMDSLGPSRS